MKLRNSLIAAAVLGAASLSAQAASENLFVDNSTIGSAQALGSLFGLGGVINVFGVRGVTDIFGLPIGDDNNADFYSFEITVPNQVVTLRVDTPEGPLLNNDPVVALYGTTGLQLINDDDSGPGFDSLLSFAVSAPGVYYAAVSGFNDFDFDGIADGSVDGIPSTNFLYNLQISAVDDPNPVPVPAAGWLLGSALLGLARRRRSAV